MKKILIALCVLISFSCFSQDSSLQKNQLNEQVRVVFNTKLNIDDLVKIKLAMQEKGIILDFLRLDFDESGKLLAIKFKVDCKDGYVGRAVSKKLYPDSKFGFYRDFSKSSTDPFGTGNL